jgi:CTP:molybdopterin cytidylyltransferase MocA
MGCILKGGGGLYSRVVVGAVLLAEAGGACADDRPPALLELGGVPLVTRLLVALSGAGVDEVVVVTGRHADAIERVLQSFPVTLVRNPDLDGTPLASQRFGLAALGGKLDAVIVAAADRPLLNAQDITALIGAWKKRPAGASVVVPSVGGEDGKPVIFGTEVREQLLAGAPDGGPGLDTGHAAVHRFETDNRRYRVGIDSADDIARFERETGHVLRWPAPLAA